MNINKKREGYRGYIFTKKIAGNFIPQRVQNLVIKDYCQRKGIFFKLSTTEFNIGYFRALKKSLNNLKKFDQGIIFYSLFMLPDEREFRFEIYSKIIKNKKLLHFALEELVIKSWKETKKVEDILSIKRNIKNL